MPIAESVVAMVEHLAAEEVSTIRTGVVRRCKNDFRAYLCSLLSLPQAVLPRQYQRTAGMTKALDSIGKLFDAEGNSLMGDCSLRKFLRGDLTDGVVPLDIPRRMAAEVEKLLGVLEVVEAMDRVGREHARETARRFEAASAFVADDVRGPFREIDPCEIESLDAPAADRSAVVTDVDHEAKTFTVQSQPKAVNTSRRYVAGKGK